MTILPVLHPDKGILSPAARINLKPTELAYICPGCEKVERFGAEVRYQRCGGCQLWYYCSTEVSQACLPGLAMLIRLTVPEAALDQKAQGRMQALGCRRFEGDQKDTRGQDSCRTGSDSYYYHR